MKDSLILFIIMTYNVTKSLNEQVSTNGDAKHFFIKD